MGAGEGVVSPTSAFHPSSCRIIVHGDVGSGTWGLTTDRTHICGDCSCATVWCLHDFAPVWETKGWEEGEDGGVYVSSDIISEQGDSSNTLE